MRTVYLAIAGTARRFFVITGLPVPRLARRVHGILRRTLEESAGTRRLQRGYNHGASFGRERSAYLTPEDYPPILEYLRDPLARAVPDSFVDWSGVRTICSLLPWFPDWGGRVSTAPPIPTDGYRSDAVEYVALALSIRLGALRGAYSVLELGAGWAPWATAGILTAHRMGISKAYGVAVEANGDKCGTAIAHARSNGLSARIVDEVPSGSGSVDVTIVRGAAWYAGHPLYFPRVPLQDMGGAAATVRTALDYRGQSIKMDEVQGFALSDLLGGHHFTLCHIDVQGSEFELLANTADIRSEVDLILLGTHSRSIEGRLIELLFARGWELLREEPCTADFRGRRPSLEGFTVVDGVQLWLSPEAGVSSADLISAGVGG
jgi:hypothetical protein